MSIDQKNPLTGEKTNVPYYSTYLSFPWLTTTLQHDADNYHQGEVGKRGGLSHSQKVGALSIAFKGTSFLGDKFAPHGIVKLVDDDRVDEYIDALEGFYEEYGNYMDKSTWFKGQLLFVDLSGDIIKVGK